MSFKHLFARSLGAAPGRLHMAAHSHHLWPDASFIGQVEAWDDAARLADRKWDRVMGEVWPEAQSHIAAELGTGLPDAIVFATNTHDFIVRIAAACPRRSGHPLRVLTSTGEFHSARRQFARWVESGEITLENVPLDGFADAASRAGHDLIFVSQLQFGSGKILHDIMELARLSKPDGPWVVIDGYHSFMALESPFLETVALSCFFLAGGYKYAMAGEGMGFLHAPPGFGPRPPITGWYAEFDDLKLPPDMVGYAPDAMRFMGATFDPSALYRFNAIRRMLDSAGLTTARISAHVADLQRLMVDALHPSPLGRAELLNPPGDHANARFLAFRSPDAARWCAQLSASDCITDVRGDVLRVGLGLYHDQADIAAFARLAARLT